MISYQVWAAGASDEAALRSRTVTVTVRNSVTGESLQIEKLDPDSLDSLPQYFIGNSDFVGEILSQGAFIGRTADGWNLNRLSDEGERALREFLEHQASDPAALQFLSDARGVALILGDDSW